MTELRCQADHPAWDKGEQYHRPHGVRLPAAFPHRLRFVRIVKRLEHVASHRVAVMCLTRDCRAVHEYEIVAEEGVA